MFTAPRDALGTHQEQHSRTDRHSRVFTLQSENKWYQNTELDFMMIQGIRNLHRVHSNRVMWGNILFYATDYRVTLLLESKLHF